jgi:hypothetical protein
LLCVEIKKHSDKRTTCKIFIRIAGFPLWTDSFFCLVLDVNLTHLHEIITILSLNNTRLGLSVGIIICFLSFHAMAFNDYANSDNLFFLPAYMEVLPDTTPNNSNDISMEPDTILVDSLIPENLSLDTVVKTSKSSDLESTVFYVSRDSSFFDMKKRRAYLFGEAIVIYGSIKLEAAFIMMDFSNNEVYAYGVRDSTGAILGKPIFTQDGETFKADTIRYNFRSKKGLIQHVTTEFDGSYLHGGRTKKQPNNEVHLVDGKFTTCDLDHPHFYFKISKAKVIPDDKIVSGPAFLVIEDVPTPLGLPFGFFPNKKGSTSGIIVPEFGEEVNRGFFLRNGGYYWAINDFMDLRFTGDIFSKGSWAARTRLNYKWRYHLSGYLDVNYNVNKIGYQGLPNFSTNKLYKVVWRHTQDPKARPNSTFSADVNISSSAYDKYNTYTPANYMQNSKTSSISYSKVWPNSPFSLSAAVRQSQNSRDSTMNFTLPDVSFGMSRIYPFKRKKATGAAKWYEKIGISYTALLTNNLSTKEDSLLTTQWKDFNNGIKHSIPISTSIKVLKYLSLSPSFNYTERWYTKSLNKQWDTSQNALLSEQINGFNRVWDYSAGASLNTKLYGMLQFTKGPLHAIRHVITPNISFQYRPNFGADNYGYYGDYNVIQYNSNTGQYDTVNYVYSLYEGSPYGAPTRGGAGAVSFNIANNLEVKVRNRADTVSGTKKIKLLESLNINTSYNIMADSLNWSPVSLSGRTRIGKMEVSFGSTFDPYAIQQNPYTDAYQRVNQSEFSSSGKFFRITTANLSTSFSLNPKARDDKDKMQTDMLYAYPDAYVDFDMPWNLRVSYNLRYNKPYEEKSLTQTLQVSGELNLTKKWKIRASSGWDFINSKITYTSINVYRDLHCWEASLSLIPFGIHKSYTFQINVRSAILQDLKLSKRRSWYDNF